MIPMVRVVLPPPDPAVAMTILGTRFIRSLLRNETMEIASRLSRNPLFASNPKINIEEAFGYICVSIEEQSGK
jgi:hypothetical protein